MIKLTLCCAGLHLLVGCSKSDESRTLPDSGVLPYGSGGTSTGTGSGGVGGKLGEAGHVERDSALATAGGATSKDAASPDPGDASEEPPIGPDPEPGCGLALAAFCEHFDEPGTTLSRAGELDFTKWSGGRGYPQGPTSKPFVVPIPPATIGACRSGLPAQVYPDQDALICEPNDAIASRHLLVAVAAQNYGQNSYRIRQPFDFAGRTGRIVFDAEGNVIDGLLGWISLSITEDPEPVPGTALGDPGIFNDEGSSVPRSAMQIHFRNKCPTPGEFSLRFVDVITDYVDALHTPDNSPCIKGAAGHLNHFEIALSRNHIQIFASDYSADGVTFPVKRMVYETDLAMPFERGYVQLTTHNHATLKYSTDHRDAWVARWDNVGFDGPVIRSWREYSAPDSLQMVTKESEPPARMNVGYAVPAQGDGTLSLKFQGVEVAGVRRASVAFSSWYLLNWGIPTEKYNLRYRLNGNAWHDRPFNASELSLIADYNGQGQFSQMLDVPVSELENGDNQLEFEAVDIPMSYPPGVYNVDLVLGL